MGIASIILLASGLTLPEAEPDYAIGATVAAACEWPATVVLSGCTGTLIHPEVIMYAAHCPNSGVARFGTTGGERAVDIDYCNRAPEYTEEGLGFDYSYCKLEAPITDVPFVPPMVGCERQQLTIGRRVVMGGFGQPGFGTKRFVEGEIAGFPNEGRKVGIFYDSPDQGTCNGDSGGPGFVQLDDGSWRTWGINSTIAPPCGGSSQSIGSWRAVQWIEEDSGVDITPCTDADGTWNPTAACTGFPMAPGDEEGLTWATGCGPGAVSGPSSTCGPAFGEPPDDVAPTLSFVTPAEGAYPGPSFDTMIELSAGDDYSVRDVVVTFDGEEQAVFEDAPYALDMVTFPEGTWQITARARDWSGNDVEASVTIVVGDAAATGDGSGTSGDDSDAGTEGGSSDGAAGDDSGGSDSEAGIDTEGDTAEQDDSGDGCGCQSDPRPGPGLLPLLLAVPAVFRRRRSRS